MHSLSLLRAVALYRYRPLLPASGLFQVSLGAYSIRFMASVPPTNPVGTAVFTPNTLSLYTANWRSHWPPTHFADTAIVNSPIKAMTRSLFISDKFYKSVNLRY